MTSLAVRDECRAGVGGRHIQARHRGKASEIRTCRPALSWIVVLARAEERDDLPNPDVLKDRCLHPAEKWALTRRANRPCPAPRRLPVVARVG